MADEVDRSNEQAQRILEAQLAYRKPSMNIKPKGKCHFCGNVFEEDSLKLFCDSDCAKNHDRKTC